MKNSKAFQTRVFDFNLNEKSNFPFKNNEKKKRAAKQIRFANQFQI